MGRGDRRSRRGKIWRGSYGKTRRPSSEKRAAKAAQEIAKSKSE